MWCSVSALFIVEAAYGFGGVGGFDSAAGRRFDFHERVDADSITHGESAGLVPANLSESDRDGCRRVSSKACRNTRRKGVNFGRR